MPDAKQIDFLLAGYIDGTNGLPLAGGKVYTYSSGTSTALTVWTAGDKSGVAANPIILDSQGRAVVYADGNYRFKIDDANDVTQSTLDNMFYDPSAEANRAYKAISANYTATASDDFLDVSASSGNITITLPTAVSIAGTEYVIKKNDTSTNTVTIDAAGTQTIDGELTWILAQTQSYVAIRSDGANWKIVQDGFSVGFKAERGSSQAIPTGADTKIQYATENFDRQAWYDNATNYRFTPKIRGEYTVMAAVEFDDAADGDTCKIIVKLNGSSNILTGRITASQANDDVIPVASGVVNMNGSTDYIEAYANHDSAATLNVGVSADVSRNYFTAELLRR